jgi:hypothetical protein
MDSQRGGQLFRLILIKPSHYDEDGYVIQWLRSPIPANSLAQLGHLRRGFHGESTDFPDVLADFGVISTEV